MLPKFAQLHLGDRVVVDVAGKSLCCVGIVLGIPLACLLDGHVLGGAAVGQMPEPIFGLPLGRGEPFLGAQIPIVAQRSEFPFAGVRIVVAGDPSAALPLGGWAVA